MTEKTIADQMFIEFKEHSVAEFFRKNRQMLGFSGKIRSLTTIVHEFCTNSLDACEEAGILPDIKMEIRQLEGDHIKVIASDNGPGIPKSHLGKALGMMLAGTKFHRHMQMRGQQGIGACMSGDTLVPLADGTIKPIKKIVDENMTGKKILALNLEHLSLTPAKIVKCWKIKNPEFIRIKTQKGRNIRLTPENPVLTIIDGKPTWIRADKLEKGMRIAAPTRIFASTKKVRTIDLFDHSIQVDEPKLLTEIEAKLLAKHGSLAKASKATHIHKDVLRNWFRRKMKNGSPRGRPPLSLLLKIAREAGFDEEEIMNKLTRIGRNGTYIRIPKFLTTEIAWLAGVIAGDGHLTSEKDDKWGVGITFTNKNKQLIDKFDETLKRVFGVKTNILFNKKRHYYTIQSSSTQVAHILEAFGIPRGKKFDCFDLSNLLFSLDDEIIAAYLRGLFDAEGSVAPEKHSITLSLYNKPALEKIFYALLRLGIFASINKACSENRLLITGREQIKRFAEKVGFSNEEKMQKVFALIYCKTNTKTESIPNISSLAKEYVYSLDFPLTSLPCAPYNSIITRDNVSKYAVRQILNVCGVHGENGRFLVDLCDGDVVWLEITEISYEDNDEGFVYDLEVEGHHNFIAGGLITHNSGCVMFAQMTTGKPAHVKSGTGKKIVECDLSIDVQTNKPLLMNVVETDGDFHGLIVEAEFAEVKYDKSEYGPFEYLRRSALANPHAQITFIDPFGEKTVFPRVSDKIPRKPPEVQPHPLGITTNDLIDLAHHSPARKLSSFFTSTFARFSSSKVNELRSLVPEIDLNRNPRELKWSEAEAIVKAFQQTKWIAPATDSIQPIGEEQIEKAFKNILNPEFFSVRSRRPKVFRGGVPFAVEAAVAYGGKAGRENASEGVSSDVHRFANRAPLLFDAGGCAITEAVKTIDWARYDIKDFENTPMSVFVNFVSVYVPYTGAGKQAVSPEEEIVSEIRFAIMEVVRDMQRYLSGKVRETDREAKKKAIMRYVHQLSLNLPELAGAGKSSEIEEKLVQLIQSKYAKSLDLEAGETEENKGEKESSEEKEGEEKEE